MMLDGVENARDVGGIPTRDGSIRGSVLLRSGDLAGITVAGRAQACALGIGTVIDLRSPVERERAPEHLDGAAMIQLPLLEGAMDPAAFRAAAGRDTTTLPDLAEVYLGMLADGGEVFAEIAHIMATAEHAVLVHCTAGKDRTGMAVGLLLDAVGADRDAVLDDYAASAHNLSAGWVERTLAGLAGFGIPATADVAALATRSPREALGGVLARLDAGSGAVGYLRDHGLSDADLAALTARLSA